MDKVLLFLQKVWTWLLWVRHNLVLSVSQLFGVSEFYGQWITIAIFAFVVVVLFLIKIHHGMIKMQKKRVEKLVYEYDRIWYLEAKAMYTFNQHMKAQGQVNQLAHGTRSVLQLDNKDYLVNKKKIIEDIKKLETYFNQKIVPDETIKKILSLHRKVSSSNMLHQVVGRGLVVMTAGLYLLKWERVYYK